VNKKYIYTPNLNSQSSPAKVIKLVEERSNVLEIGCSSGSQTKILTKTLECTVTGIEINPEAASDAARFCDRIITGNIENIDLTEALGDSRYDFIILSDVLEHLHSPNNTLTKLSTYLNESGSIIASIPNIAHIGLIFELANGKFDYRQFGLLDDTHIRFFTKKSIYHLFESAGYNISLLDRTTCSFENSEFKTIVTDSKDKEIVKYIESHNPEFDTYQFIVKAELANPQAAEKTNIHLQEEIENLKKEIEENKIYTEKLKSNIRWLEQSILKRTITKLKHIIS